MARKIKLVSDTAQEFNRTFLEDPDKIVVEREFNSRVSRHGVETLAQDILANGQIQPIVCRRGNDGELILIAGQRRLSAIQYNNGKGHVMKVRVEVVDKDDLDALLLNIAENHEQEGLSMTDYAHQIGRLVEVGMTPAKIATVYKKSKVWVSYMRRIDQLDESIKRQIDGGLIDFSTASTIVGLKTPEEQLKAADAAAKFRANRQAGRATGSAREAARASAGNKAAPTSEGVRKRRTRGQIVSLFEDELKADGTVEEPGMLAGLGEILSKYAEGYYTDKAVQRKIRSWMSEYI